MYLSRLFLVPQSVVLSLTSGGVCNIFCLSLIRKFCLLYVVTSPLHPTSHHPTIRPSPSGDPIFPQHQKKWALLHLMCVCLSLQTPAAKNSHPSPTSIFNPQQHFHLIKHYQMGPHRTLNSIIRPTMMRRGGRSMNGDLDHGRIHHGGIEC